MTDAADVPVGPRPRDIWLAILALATSGGTLVCCVLPAVLVSLGAGAALAGLVTAVPQLVWLSAHKALVFGSAGIALLVSGLAINATRKRPCPVDPVLGAACMRLRRVSAVLWFVALACTTLGATFAFVLPLFV